VYRRHEHVGTVPEDRDGAVAAVIVHVEYRNLLVFINTVLAELFLVSREHVGNHRSVVDVAIPSDAGPPRMVTRMCDECIVIF
jgi:hypothetical protein